MGRLSGNYAIFNKHDVDAAIRELESKYKTPYMRVYKVLRKGNTLEQSKQECYNKAYQLQGYLRPIASWISEASAGDEIVVTVDTSCNPIVLLHKLDSFVVKDMKVEGNQRRLDV